MVNIICLKQKWDSTTNLLECRKSKAKILNVGEDIEQQEPSFTAVRSAKWYDYFEGQFF